jgi:hypothetical protein
MNKFLIAGNHAINLDLVTYIEQIRTQRLLIHFAVPRLSISSEGGTLMPMTRDDDIILALDGDEATKLWEKLSKLS